MPIKIGIIDSGVQKNHPHFVNESIKGYSLDFDDNNTLIKNTNFDDDIGHGTAVFSIINKSLKNRNVEITNIKIFFKNKNIDQLKFEKILNYIYKTEKFDYLNISMGIINYGNAAKLNKICNRFHKNGTYIISAFNNEGAVSFPAAIKSVIGVDTSSDINLKKDEFIYIENSIIDIVAPKKIFKVPWVNSSYILTSGSSFSCAELTSVLIKKNKKSIKEICNQKIILPKSHKNKMNFKIKIAVVFPFNKEIHSLARFIDLLDFKIINFYSVRIDGQVNKRICDIIENCPLKMIIKDIDYIDWNAFDTIIIGHLNEINKITKKDYKRILLEEAIKRGKKIYSFDNILQDNQKYNYYFTPKIFENQINRRYGKLYKTNKPILCVIGTNSKQGKFTLQLLLRKQFINHGYKVGQIGTEPSSLLFGMNEVFHSGYNSQVNLHPYQICSVVNQMIWDITQEDIDIIIAGCQSGLIAYNDYNVSMIPIFHQIFFESIQPDAIILCINCFDDYIFVERIIKFAEGLSGVERLLH